MPPPLVSVIIPTLNCRDDLMGALDSVCTQTMRNIEVIISDGGSVDGTFEVARSSLSAYQIPFTILVKNNSTIYGAMNFGIRIAKGDWLYFMGSDDRLAHAHVIEELAPLFAEAKHNVIYGNAYILSQASIWPGYKFNSRSLGRSNINHQATFYRRSTLDRYRLEYDESYPLAADWEFNIKLWKYARFHYVDRVIAIYSGYGISSRSVDNSLEDRLGHKFLHVYGLRAFFFLPSYRLADACRAHPNRLYWLAFTCVRIAEAITRYSKGLLA